jgi:hypothetical protein
LHKKLESQRRDCTESSQLYRLPVREERPELHKGAASEWDKAREVQSGKKRLEPDALSTFHCSPIFAREPVSPISRLHPLHTSCSRIPEKVITLYLRGFCGLHPDQTGRIGPLGTPSQVFPVWEIRRFKSWFSQNNRE